MYQRYCLAPSPSRRAASLSVPRADRSAAESMKYQTFKVIFIVRHISGFLFVDSFCLLFCWPLESSNEVNEALYEFRV